MTTETDREIPAGVYWNAESANFYTEFDRRGCGMAFYLMWKDRSGEFPSCDGFGNQYQGIDDETTTRQAAQ